MCREYTKTIDLQKCIVVCAILTSTQSAGDWHMYMCPIFTQKQLAYGMAHHFMCHCIREYNRRQDWHLGWFAICTRIVLAYYYTLLHAQYYHIREKETIAL